MDKATEEVKRIAANAIIKNWRTTTYEGRAFFPSAYNWMVLFEDGIKWMTGGLTVENLTAAYLKLSRIYDFTKDARPTKRPAEPQAEAPAEQAAGASGAKTPAAEPVEIPENELPGYPVRGGLEDGWRYQQRLTAWREQRAQQAWKERENKRLAAQPPADSTIRRTKADLKLRRLEQEQWALKKSNQS